ncbi:MAG: DUF3298 domain-containing protein [Elusimicrobiota bacterium]|jgi:hypothetical protein
MKRAALLVVLLCAASAHSEDLSWQPVHIKKSYGRCGDYPCVRAELAYPLFEAGASSEALNAVNGAVRGLLGRSIIEGQDDLSFEAWMNDLLAQYMKLRRARPELPGNWWLQRESTVLSTAPVLSLSCEESAYTGGAHPSVVRKYLVFDPPSGRRLFLEDLLRRGALAKLMKAAERRLRILRKVPEGELSAAGFLFKDGRFALPGEFALADEGLRLRYDAGSVLPYARGAIDLVVPFSDLKGVLKREYLPK